MDVFPISYPEKYCLFKNCLRKTADSEPKIISLMGRKSRAEAVFYTPAFPDISIFCYSSIKQIPYKWDELAAHAPAMLHRSFLSALEAAPPTDLQPHYILFYKNRIPIGIAYFQLVRFNARQSVKIEDSPAEQKGLSVTFLLKKWLSQRLSYTFLVSGNALLTGENAFYFQRDKCSLSEEDQSILVEKASWQLATHLRRGGASLDAVIHKDVYSSNLKNYRNWRLSRYHAFDFQPSMEFHLRPEWRSFEDYLENLSSKYRVRARRAAKKAKNLRVCRLSLLEIRRYSQDMFALYEQIAQKAAFNGVHLHPDYFYQLKKQLGDHFEVLAYFDGEKMAGFCSILHHDSRSEAFFLGLDPQYNHSAQLYLNMLYDIIKRGIEKKKKHIGFARTAMAIKSSVGAEPERLYGLIKFFNPILNRAAPFIIRLLTPKAEWRQRRPFRSEIASI